jgi:alkaline phosphatase
MLSRVPGRQALLIVVVFVATLVLLAGTWAVVTRSTGTGPASTRSDGPTTGAANPTPAPSGSDPAASALSPVPGSSGASPSSGGPNPSASEPAAVVLVGAGDIGVCSLEGARRTSDLLLEEEGTVFTLGDNAYPNGRTRNYEECYDPTWGRLLDRTLLPVIGNHDWHTAGAAGYRAYFGDAAGTADATWYSRDIGAWHVIVLDSECDKVGGCDDESPQGRWLAADLAASTARCTLALWHAPRFSSGLHGNDRGVQPFWSALQEAGADLVVNGHDHDYERFAPLDADGDVLRPGGMREIVAGTGGAELRPFEELAAHSEFRLAGSWGILRLTLHAASYEWEFVPVSGDVADAGSTPCH